MQMQVIAPQPRRVHPLQSLFFKCTFVVAICVLMVVSVIEYRNLASMERKAIEAIAQRAEEVTELLSIQMGGSIKFGNIEAVEAIVEGVLQTSGRDMTGIVVLDADGSLLYQSKSFVDVGLAEKVVDNARESLTSREPFQASDGMTFAAPTLFGGGDAIVGVVASVWSPEAALASLAANRNETLLIAIGVFAAALLAAGLYLRTRMSQPLVRLGRAMEHVANDDYDIEVPSIGRKDEIGQMAGRLDEFRMSLAAAKEQQAEATLKGAAFEGSSAAMMMVDLSYKVVSANPAAKQLLQSLMPDLSKVWADADPDALVGGDLSQMAIVQEALRGVLDKATADGDTLIHERLTFEIGGQTLRLAISPAADSDGNIFGCVVEWADRTKSQRDAALLLSINEAQASVSFNTSGKVVDANENFLSLIKGEFKDTAECSLTRMFAGNLENDPEGKEFGRQVFEGTLRNGRFKAYSVHADTTYVLEGSFSVIKNVKGGPESVTFLGLDVTDQERQLNEAEAARLKNAEEQDDVVKRLGAALKELANGDLLCDIKDNMPPAYAMLRDDFNATVTSLRDAISKVTHNAASIRSETAEITSAADDLSRRTEKQAATLEETAAALDELTVSVRSAAEGADDASKMSADAQNNAEQGGEVARKAVTAMDGIKNSSQEISKITSVIDDIAFQTNLLALNAGVEAARAGEAGRGFAVVATEVRALAQRSSDAAREINELISSSGEQVQLGVDLVDKTGKALASIVTAVSEISDRVSTIAASSREQSSGLAEINTAVNELDHVTQQNAAMFEETTAASHALTSEADALVDAVARFKTGSEGSVAPSEVVPVAPAAAPATPAAAVTRGNTVMQPQEEIVSDGWEEF